MKDEGLSTFLKDFVDFLKDLLRALMYLLQRVLRYLARSLGVCGLLLTYFVVPAVALLLAVSLIDDYTSLGRTNGLLIILVLSVWYSAGYVASRIGTVARNIEMHIVRLSAEMGKWPDGTVITNPDGSQIEITSRKSPEAIIVVPGGATGDEKAREPAPDLNDQAVRALLEERRGP